MIFDERVFLSVYDPFTAWSVPNKIGATFQLEIRSISNEGKGQFLIRIMVKLK